MYLIVEFIDNKAVNIIPDSWFYNGMTRWPSYSSDNRINRAVQKNEEPGEDWKSYDVRVLSRAGKFSLSLLTHYPFQETEVNSTLEHLCLLSGSN